MDKQAIAEVFKTSPPVAYFGAWLAGFSVAEIVTVLTGIYTILLIAEKAVHVYKKWKSKKLE